MKKVDIDWRVFQRLLNYVRQHLGYFLAAVLGMLIYALSNAGFAMLMEPLIDEGLIANNEDPIVKWLPLLIILVLFARGVGTFLGTYYMEYVGQFVVKQLRSKMFDQILHLPTSYYQYSPVGAVISKLTFNIDRTANVSAKALTVIIRDTLTTVGLLIWLFYISWAMVIIILLLLPVVIYVLKYMTHRFRSIHHQQQELMGQLTDSIQQAVRTNRTIKLFGGYDHEIIRFEKDNERNRRYRVRSAAVKSIGIPVVMILIGFSMASIVHLFTTGFFASSVTPGAFVSFLVTMILIFRPVRNLVGINAVLQEGMVAAHSIFEFLDMTPESDVENVPITQAFKAHICFVDVSYSYQNIDDSDLNTLVLKHVDLEILPKQMIALVGASGAGKSTLVSLLPRLYDCDSGRIEIDGYDIKNIPLSKLRAQIAYAGQDIMLFNDSIANNISYGRKASFEQIKEAATKAHALEFIEQLPEGFNTIIGDSGTCLSGGEGQRLAIARALLKKAPIMIFDEATSALDSHSENMIKQTLEEIATTSTMIVIAHRFSTLQLANRIVVLEQGRIVEQGEHDELLAKQGTYHKLYFSSHGRRMIA